MPIAPVADLAARLPSERRRVNSCGVAGLVIGSAVGVGTATWQLGVLAGWIAAGATMTAWVTRDLWPLDAETTATVATREDNSRRAARLLLLVASVISLVAVAAGLRRASQADTDLQIALSAVSMAAIAVSWIVVHTVFTLRYAHLHYGGAAVGGFTFPGPEPPAYRDFAYLAFTVGMTFQVSDTTVDTSSGRSTVLGHSLLSYVFGTAIIASTINVVAGLIGR